MIEIMILVVSILYVGMFWQPQMSSDYHSSSKGCNGKHMPYTNSDEPAVIAHNHLVISMDYLDLKKLRELTYLYKGTKTGDELYTVRRKRVLYERRKVHENIPDLNKKREFLKKLQGISIKEIDKKKLDNISIYDLERIIRYL